MLHLYSHWDTRNNLIFKQFYFGPQRKVIIFISEEFTCFNENYISTTRRFCILRTPPPKKNILICSSKCKYRNIRKLPHKQTTSASHEATPRRNISCLIKEWWNISLHLNYHTLESIDLFCAYTTRHWTQCLNQLDTQSHSFQESKDTDYLHAWNFGSNLVNWREAWRNC